MSKIPTEKEMGAIAEQVRNGTYLDPHGKVCLDMELAFWFEGEKEAFKEVGEWLEVHIDGCYSPRCYLVIRIEDLEALKEGKLQYYGLEFVSPKKERRMP